MVVQGSSFFAESARVIVQIIGKLLRQYPAVKIYRQVRIVLLRHDVPGDHCIVDVPGFVERAAAVERPGLGKGAAQLIVQFFHGKGGHGADQGRVEVRPDPRKKVPRAVQSLQGISAVGKVGQCLLVDLGKKDHDVTPADAVTGKVQHHAAAKSCVHPQINHFIIRKLRLDERAVHTERAGAAPDQDDLRTPGGGEALAFVFELTHVGGVIFCRQSDCADA